MSIGHNSPTAWKFQSNLFLQHLHSIKLNNTVCLQPALRFLISNFRRVQHVVCFLLGNSPASEFYMPTFQNTLFHLHRQVGVLYTYLPMKMEQTECSETSAYKIQMPGNYPEENIQQL
jgi:hypothetical protein